MPKKKIIKIFFLGITIFSCLLVPYLYKGQVGLVKNETSGFFVVIPIAKFTQSDLPCLNVEIEDKEFLALLDLGYTRYVSAAVDISNKISEKTFLRTSTNWGFRGTPWFHKIYQIPLMHLGGLTFSPIPLDEENDGQRQEGVIVKSQDAPAVLTQGKLGWKLFKDMALYLDLDHDTMTACDSLETFQKQGHSLAHFVKVPLILERELIEFEIGTPKGPLRCFLDTGCTSNHLQMHNKENIPLEELYFDEQRIVRFPRFRIGNQQFGPLTFHPIPINIPIRTQAVLGMDFLFDHKVFIDFKNRYIYFCRNEESS